MKDLTVESVTDAVLAQMDGTEDARLREVMAAGVRHLHAFAREVHLTPAEWLAGIAFLTRVGQRCTDDRQEFILLSDTLGLSALVNLLHDETARDDATESSLLGPFFRESAPELASGAQVAADTSAGEIVLWGRVTDTSGRPIAGASVDVWQTASSGLYDMQLEGSGDDCRGRFRTDGNGDYAIRTVRPVGYSIPMDGPVGALVKQQGRHGMRPAHIHFLISAPGHRELVTALYMAGDPHIADDVVFGVTSTLVVTEQAGDAACPIHGLPSIRYDFQLARATPAHADTGRVGSDPARL